MVTQIGENVFTEILELEDAGWHALSQAGRGVPFYQRVMLDEGVMVFAVGVFDKATALAGIAGAPPWSTYRIDDPRFIPLGDDAVTLTYAVHATRPAQEPFDALITSTYARDDRGAWRLGVHTQTPIATSESD